MIFVDDAKSSFDALQFCTVIRAVLGTGRKSATVALGDGEAMTSAVTALEAFSSKAAQKDAVDVIVPYLQMSPAASELFSSLSLVSVAVPIVLAGLDCLTEIVQYAYATENQTPAVLAARAVAKDIVKARAAALYEVFAAGRSKCSRKAIFLLQTVASAHPLLAKELVNRFDLTSQHFTPFLCNPDNHACRIPYLALIGTLIATRDSDILKYFSTKGRSVIHTCVKVIADRMKRELQHEVDTQKGQSGSSSSRSQKSRFVVMPSHVQRREIGAAIAFLRLFRNVFISFPITSMRRAIFGPPLPRLLTYISAAQMPPLSVSPRQVTADQLELRTVARDVFLGIAADVALPGNNIVAALSTRGDIPSTSLALDVLRTYPHLRQSLLQASSFITATPRLTVSWLANVAVLSTALSGAPSPTTGLHESRMLDAALTHKSSFVRHIGATLTLAMSRLVEKDPSAMAEPQKYLPSPKDVRYYAQNVSKGDVLTNELLASYQRIFDINDEDDVNRDLIYAALVASQFNYLASEYAIRNALHLSPRETLIVITGRFYLSGMIIQASRTSDKVEQSQLWNLSAHVIRQADLFPQGTLHDVDIILAVLSSMPQKSIKTCAKALEDVIHKAIGLPFGLFDETYGTSSCNPNPCPRASLLITAIFLRFRKLCNSSMTSDPSSDNLSLCRFFKEVLLAHVACDEVLKGHALDSSYLSQSLSTLISNEDLWWSTNEAAEKHSLVPCRQEACNAVMGVLSDHITYPETTYLASIRMLSQFYKVLRTQDSKLWKSVKQSIGPILGLVWNTSATERGLQLEYDSQSDAGMVLFHNKSEQRLFEFNDTVGLLLATMDVYPSEHQVGDELRRLRQELGKPCFTLLICLILRTTGDRDVQRVTRGMILETLTLERVNSKKEPMYVFCQDSLIAVLRTTASMTAGEIERVITYAVDTITGSVSFPEAQNFLSFSLKIIESLVYHSQHMICAHARFFLSTKSLSHFPSLLTLTTESANLLTLILPHLPGLHQLIVQDLYSWDVVNSLSFATYLLPLISISLYSVVDTNLDDKIAVEREKMSMLLLKNGHMFSSELPISDFDCFNDSVFDAVRHLGSWSNLDAANVISILLRLRDVQQPFDTEANTVSLLWIYFSHLCSTQDMEATFSPTCELVEMATYLVHLVGNNLKDENNMNLSLPISLYKMLLCVQKRLSVRNERLPDSFSSSDNPLNWAFGIFVFSLSNWIDDFELSEKANKNERFLFEKSIFNVLYQSLSIIMSFGVVEESVIELAIKRLSRGRWSYLKCNVLDDSNYSNYRETASYRSFVITVCDFLSKALPHLKGESESDDIVLSLYSAREAIAEIDSFQANQNDHDTAIWRCVRALDQYLSRLNKTALNLSVRDGNRFFQQSASAVLCMFSPQMLESARENVYNWGVERKLKILPLSKTTIFSEDNLQSGTNSEFVLRIFFAACVEALGVSKAAVLDIGKIVKDGVLTVALTALSAPNEKARTLGYACVEIFARVVGPIEKVASESAVGLYRHRRQLAFLLSLLRNSCDEPVKEILPLFISWFIACLRVVLHPVHDAYKIVTSLFLRGPFMDVTDCVGVFHLLNCKGTGAEIRAARLIGLEALQYGVRSARDVIILRRRKVLDALFMYGGSANGLDSLVRVRALKVLDFLVRRTERVNLTAELCHTYGIVTWLATDVGEDHSSETLQMMKLSLLHRVIEHSSEKDAERLAHTVTDAFGALVKQTLNASFASSNDRRTFQAITRCATTIASVFPCRLSLFDVDFDKLYKDTYGTLISDQQRDVVRLISFQRSTSVTDATLHTVLLVRVQDVESGYFDLNNDADLQHVLHLDSFLARCLTARFRNKSESHGDSNLKMRGLLARALQRLPSVWLVIAVLAYLTLSRHISCEIEEVAACIPANPPEVNIEVMAQFKTVLKNKSWRLINALLT